MKRIRRILCPAENANAALLSALSPALLTTLLMMGVIIGVVPTGAQSSHAAPVPAPTVIVPATLPELPLPQANSIQTSASAPAVVAATVSKVTPVQNLQTSTVFQRWLDEDVLYIITQEERVAFNALGSDEERDQFIQQFWLRRDPTPGTPVNEYKEDHYGRIAYANEKFSTSERPGWATDRGAVYTIYGLPAEIESLGAGPGGAAAYEIWRYRYIGERGQDLSFRFNSFGNGDYRLVGPQAGISVEQVPQERNSRIEAVFVSGNRRIPTDTILYSIRTRPGDEMDSAVIARDVKALIDLGLFEEIVAGRSRGPRGGQTVTFNVKEAPVVVSIQYEGIQSLIESEITQRLLDAKGTLAIEAPYSRARATETANLLRAMMAEKGYKDTTVEIVTERVPPNCVIVTFIVKMSPAVVFR